MEEPINLQCIRCCEHVGYEYLLAFEELSVSGNIHHQIKKVYFVQHPPCDSHHSLQKFTPRQP